MEDEKNMIIVITSHIS